MKRMQILAALLATIFAAAPVATAGAEPVLVLPPDQAMDLARARGPALVRPVAATRPQDPPSTGSRKALWIALGVAAAAALVAVLVYVAIDDGAEDLAESAGRSGGENASPDCTGPLCP